MNRNSENHLIVIFGASGDLTERKLLPALFALFKQNLLPTAFCILGVSRSELSDSSFREKMRTSIKKHSASEEISEEFLSHLHYLSLDTREESEYVRLREKIIELDIQYAIGGNHLFYLATPPEMYEIIPAYLAAHGLNQAPSGSFARKLIVEKPFGTDLLSAQKLNQSLLKYFHEDQIYRIDHYLGKETVQNLLVTRFSNSIFEPLWNRNYIQHVEITAAESLGIENRGGYYDQSGAMRDMVQNHLLQLTGLVAMEPPSMIESTSIRNEIAKVFHSLRPYKDKDIDRCIIRGQYTSSNIRGSKVSGYRDEKGVHPESRTETYVAMKLFIDNWRWAGVPFYIRTGKRLPTRVTEIVIHFSKPPHLLFSQENQYEAVKNQLIIRIQPDEGILLKFGMKIPGFGFKVREVGMDFHYKDLSDTSLPEAYERLLLDCILGDPTLYTRSDTLEAAWKFVDPVLQYWQNHPQSKVYGYPSGTWGPESADYLFGEDSPSWRYPCKNLADDGIYCEL